MQIQINTGDSTPYYSQIAGQVRYLVASGQLAPGEQLPTIRQLAERITVNPNTVARAYRDLEAEGLVEARRGAGVFVTATVSPLSQKEKLRTLTEGIDNLLVTAKQLGFDSETLLRLLKQRQKKLER